MQQTCVSIDTYSTSSATRRLHFLPQHHNPLPQNLTLCSAPIMKAQGKSVDDITEEILRKLSASRQRVFAESKPEDKAGDGLWATYLDSVEDEDRASVESWNGSTTGILAFVSPMSIDARMLTYRLPEWSLRCDCCCLRNREL